MQQNTFLELDGIACRYGATQVLNDIDLAIDKGEFVALLGSSGCGKTTLLRVLAGFVAPTAGRVQLRQKDVTSLPPDRRGVSLVFQSYALWPHMTVAQNIGYGLRLRRVAKAEIARRVGEVQSMLGLDGLGERKPAALSGGQRQRVALGRALAVDPEILLLDEPLSNLDARIRLSVRHELRALQRRLGITAVHVTHDREEAMVMADRIVILDAGRIAQQGTPEEVYNRPASAFVAAFMGAENILQLTGSPEGDRFAIAAGPANAGAHVPLAGRPLGSGPVDARFRPEAARIAAAGSALPEGGAVFHGTVLAASYPGGVWRHTIRIGEAEIMADAAQAFAPGDRVDVHVPAEALFLFDRPQTHPPVAPVSRTATAGKVPA
ncbi:ABC transporter ATP-binding protein [Rhizobiaceae bacterium BDR2-2]|uniref:ABC transporter ATP-binding protein n=1 Tax=Ectorhizobium quercum TaxID=2965071 RepID=A0AAE3SXA2_9HYPH|nr:ABC transporter ATP-binding protein [Ectorhizobium quercum]MCX8998275.1 ABC transporter ATP-binding protein [Ectorhizobium quercum]